jgi:beta-glucuronidase
MRSILNGVALCAAVLGLATQGFAQIADDSEIAHGPMLTGNTTVLADVDHRKSISLDGEWHTIVDPYFSGLYSFHHQIKSDGFFQNYHAKGDETGPVEYDFAKSPTLKVPGDWNTQRPDLFVYEGPVWYQRDFDYTPKPGTKVFLHIGAANYKSWFWVNGKAICTHEGGFTAFDCDATAALHAGANFVVAAVEDQRQPDGVPTLETDWWNYGGLTRDVSLVETPERYIDDYDLHLDRATRSRVEGWVHVAGAAEGTPVTVAIGELHASVTATTAADGRAAIALAVPGVSLWSPENPKLYNVFLKAGEDALVDPMGFRTVETRGTEILLNGKPVFLKGISIHAEAPYRTGRAYSQQDVDTLLGWAHELGCNFVRLAHYPHDQRMTRTADRMGILVWSEIPTYWAIQFDNPVVLAKAESQLTEAIRRDRDKASIILWSVANETPNTAARTKFLTTLVGDAHALDGSRLVTAALLVRGEGTTKIIDDPLGKVLDVIGANEYIGWYEQRPETAEVTNWDIRYQKPLIISEFGGGAKYGLHGPETQRWTEEYEASIYKHQLVMLNKIPQLRGTTPWILMDFRSPNRLLPGVQDDFNRKGLISEKGEKKQAFFVLQKAYKTNALGKAE